MAELKKADLKSMNIPEDKLRQLKQAFPEVITEGLKVDIDKLRLTLGENVDAGRERFGMNWPGKADCFKNIQAPSVATLIPSKEESINFETNENLFIEGDNLEVLKLLQKSYYGKIKMIYIDPPYNTGKEFIYPDNFTESLDTYLRYSGQIDDQGRKYSTNAEADGRFHSKWLNMMYSRLYLSRHLLREDGVIFISIGQEELSNLLNMCNEIFGEENRIGLCSRVMKTGGNKGKFFSPNIEYLLIYSRNIEKIVEFREDLPQDLIDKVYTQVQTQGARSGEKYRLMGLYQPGLDERANQRYWIKMPDGSFVIPPGQKVPDIVNEGAKIAPSQGDGVWRWIYGRFKSELEKGNVVFKETDTSPLIDQNGKKSKWNIYTKIWLNDRLEEGRVPVDLIDKYENRHSSQEMKDLGIPFEFAKPVKFIIYMIDLCGVGKDDIVLDFFAGSCTTADAVLECNKKDGGSRRFICVQLPESTEEGSEAFREGYKTIADIGKERIRRVIKKIQDERTGQLDFKQDDLNLGFKVFKLTQSNFKLWEGSVDPKKEVVEKQLEMHVDHINSKSSQEDILFELLLKAGFELTTKIEKVSMVGKTVYSIEGGLMLICLEKELTKEVIKAMAEKCPSRVICLDQGFVGNDQLKTNAVQIMKSKGVEDFRTV
ncbi:MAG: site-specific DNA-methyltransferase [Candidatus Omnitrophica bacterium]|nr:site-specific DNA-methyltransferase [Candidatus Omnitrophota bacterium]